MKNENIKLTEAKAANDIEMDENGLYIALYRKTGDKEEKIFAHNLTWRYRPHIDSWDHSVLYQLAEILQESEDRSESYIGHNLKLLLSEVRGNERRRYKAKIDSYNLEEYEKYKMSVAK